MPANDLRLKGTRDLRRGRVSVPGNIYLVTFTTSERRRHFAEFETGCRACRALCRPDLWQDASLLAWVLMPDHWHGLIQLGASDSLSTCVARLKSAVTRELRTDANTRADVWMRGFHDRALRREDDLRAMARYLVLNPARAGLVRSPWNYSFWDAVWVEGLWAGHR